VQAGFPGSSTTSSRRATLKRHAAATELGELLDGSTSGELIPELVRRGLQQLIELEATAVIGADRHERSEERANDRNGNRSRSLSTQADDIDLLIPLDRISSPKG
jgi:transposase-like protein